MVGSLLKWWGAYWWLLFSVGVLCWDVSAWGYEGFVVGGMFLSGFGV